MSSSKNTGVKILNRTIRQSLFLAAIFGAIIVAATAMNLLGIDTGFDASLYFFFGLCCVVSIVIFAVAKFAKFIIKS